MADSAASSDHGLSRLFRLDADAESCWGDVDLADIWRHQLAASLAADLELPELPRSMRTFGALFELPTPPLELLEQVKQFARRAVSESPPLLPREIATMLYLVANCAAQVRLRTKISSATPASLAAQLQQALTQSWLDDGTRQLLQSAQSVVTD